MENCLPGALAGRSVAVLEIDLDAAPGTGAGLRKQAGWLEQCRKFDAGELGSGDVMASVLEKVMILRDASLFTGLSGEELYPVAEIASASGFAPGDVVVKEGDPGDALFVVASGAFEIQKAGKRLRALGPGAVFGEMALLDGAPRAATIVASEEGQVLRIPRAEFEALLDESPELSRGVIRTLLGHLRGDA